MRLPTLLFSLLLSSLPAGGVNGATLSAQESPPVNDRSQEFDYDTALKFSQDAIDNPVRDYLFVNSDGNQVKMGDLRGKPLVLSMIYTSCYQICPMTTRHLANIVEKAREALGGDSFSVAVIGFDTRFDTPEAMQHFADKQGISDSGWNFLSVAQNDIEALMKDVGFVYYPSSNGFDHIIQATIVDANGKVYRQVYGQAFDTPLLIDPLIELVLGRPTKAQSVLSNLATRIKFFCTTYDPVRDGYYFDYSIFLGMLIGASIIIYTGIFVVRELRKDQNIA